MREHRLGLARFAAGTRELNLFSYTGALGWRAGAPARRAWSPVDTSAGVQAWARGNFCAPGLALEHARWRLETGDAARFLARAARDKERYDLDDP